VLVADDEEYLRIAYADTLQEVGFEVECVDSIDSLIRLGPEADVLLVDARMHEMEARALETIATLVAEGKIAQDVPIILYSIAQEHAPLFQKGLTMLRNNQKRFVWLQSPFELEMLIDIINKELRR
jgi:CheY-like chemotaxis protein